MPIIDAQVHAYERDHPERPWHAVLPGPDEATGAQMVEAMDRVGVDGALLVSPWTMYRYDPSYALEVHSEHPGRFGLITPIDPLEEGVAERVAAWSATPGAVGVRLIAWNEGAEGMDHAGVGRVCDAAARQGLPVCVLCWGHLEIFERLAASHPDTQFVIDHLGLVQPFEPPPPPSPFEELPRVLALSRYPNVAIKVTGACTLSHEPFPFRDLREPVDRVLASFGLDRCMWGTDWTRATALVSYADAVEAFRLEDWLSPGDREALMGGTAAKIFDWVPEEREAPGGSDDAR